MADVDVVEQLKSAVPPPEPPPKPIILRGKVEAYGVRLSYSLPKEELMHEQHTLNMLVRDMASLLQFAAWSETSAIDILHRLRMLRNEYMALLQVFSPEEYAEEEERGRTVAAPPASNGL